MILSWPYIAGFYDGEGCASVTKFCRGGSDGRGRLTVQIAQAGLIGQETLIAISEFLFREASIYGGVYKKAAVEGSKQGYALSIAGWKNGVTFLTAVYPYLNIKRQLAQDIIRYSKVFPTMGPKLTGRLARESRVANLARLG